MADDHRGAHLADQPADRALDALRRKVDGVRIGIVHYGEHVPLDDGYRPARMGQLAAWLTEAGAHVVRFSPTYSQFAGAQRPEAWTGTVTGEGTVVMVPTGSFASTRGAARFKFFRDFARGAAEAISADPVDVAVVGYPPPGVVTALRRRMGRQLPVIADVRDLWPDAVFSAPRRSVATAAAAAGRALATELRLADGVVAMSPTMLRRAPAARRRQAIPLSVSDALRDVPTASSCDEGLRAVFVGIVTDFFDLVSVVEGWKRYLDRRAPGPVPKLEIWGTGDLEEELARRSAGIEGIVLGGWLQSSDVPAKLAAADVGLAPTQPGLGTTLGNKVLEYLGTGAYVLHSLEDEASVTLATDGLGERVASNDSAGWADGFAALDGRLASLRAARHERRAVALRRYGREGVEPLWLAEITRLLDR